MNDTAAMFLFAVSGVLVVLGFFGVTTVLLDEGRNKYDREMDLALTAFVGILGCLGFFVLYLDSQVPRPVPPSSEVVRCADSPHNVQTRIRWCEDEGWKLTPPNGHNPYQECIRIMIGRQRDNCEKGKP